jgi:hypothetical protein
LKVNQPVALDVSDDEAEPEAAQVVLALHVAIDGHEDIEALGGKSQEFAVLAAAPTCLRNGLHRVTGKGVFEPRRQTLV